jgi:flagellar protein FlgJ
MSMSGMSLGNTLQPAQMVDSKGPGAVRVDNKKAAEEMEALFISQLVKAMRSTLPKDGIMGGGRGEDVARTLQNEALGKSMAARGGFGLAQQLLQDLNKMNPQGSDPNNPEQSAGPIGTR